MNDDYLRKLCRAELEPERSFVVGRGARILIKFHKTFASCKSDKKFAPRNVLLGLTSTRLREQKFTA